ncbi:MAG: gliding motility-associated C-terminal domain-containing protein, partial [Spirochaetes bacterium]|nr:gliding motility-associated C-terminal domain-containing protein [Spirochaetota bacterium]
GGEKITDDYGNKTIQVKIDSLGDYCIGAWASSGGKIANFSISGSLLTPNGDGRNDAIIFSFDSSLSDDRIEIKIYDSLGRLIKTLKEGQRSWFGLDEDGAKVKSGLYIYKVQAEKDYIAGKVVVTR